MNIIVGLRSSSSKVDEILRNHIYTLWKNLHRICTEIDLHVNFHCGYAVDLSHPTCTPEATGTHLHQFCNKIFTVWSCYLLAKICMQRLSKRSCHFKKLLTCHNEISKVLIGGSQVVWVSSQSAEYFCLFVSEPRDACHYCIVLFIMIN